MSWMKLAQYLMPRETAWRLGALVKSYSDTYRTSSQCLNSDADVARQLLKIREDLTGAEEEARKLLARMDSPDESPFELYRLSRELYR